MVLLRDVICRAGRGGIRRANRNYGRRSTEPGRWRVGQQLTVPFHNSDCLRGAPVPRDLTHQEGITNRELAEETRRSRLKIS